MKTSVLVPVYNEEKTVKVILDKLLMLEFVCEIIVVNDCSEDKTAETLSEYENHEIIKVIHHKRNQGKTAAINTALDHVTGEVCIIQDADLEYDPDEIIDVLGPIYDGHADVVYGSRFLVKKASRVLYFYHYLANKFLTFLSNIFTNLNMSDIETCYKAFKTPILKDVGFTSKGFGMEVEITAIIGKLNLRVYEVPISYYGRTYEEGKKIGLMDGIHAIWYILYYNIFYVRSAKVLRHINQVRKELNA